MFEGIVLGMGRVAGIEDRAGSRRLEIDVGELFAGVPDGGSVAVNGTCLTAVGSTGRSYRFDVIAETLTKTNLGRLRADDLVNLELPLAWGGPINGHLVQGHVDGVATLVARRGHGDDCRVRFEVAAQLAALLVEKGSVALDGVSLTLVDVDRGAQQFSVALIPYTLEVTTLGVRQVGEPVNLEIDHQAKLFAAVVGPAIDELRSEVARVAGRLDRLESAGGERAGGPVAAGSE